MHMMMMQMYFEASTHATLWLKSWHTATLPQYVLSLLGLVLLGISAESLAALRSRLAKSAAAGVGGGNGGWPDDDGSSAARPLLSYLEERASSPTRLRALLALLYAANVSVAYLAMLAVMTYNVGYFLAVVAGYALGHYLCADAKYGVGGGEACCPQ